jgi:hypothetical protein
VTSIVVTLAEGGLEKALTQAGFTHIQTEVLECSVDFSSVEELTQFLREVNAPLVGLLADQPAKLQAEYWRRLTEADGGGATVCHDG